MEPMKYKHAVVGSNFHLQFTPKYRRDVFRDEVIITECKRIFYEIADRWGVAIKAVAFGPDHRGICLANSEIPKLHSNFEDAHLFISGCKNYSVAKLAQYFKGASSRFLRKNYWDRIKGKLYGDSFWSDGYFAESIGRVTSDSIAYYIERQQGKHWKHEDYDIYLRSQQDLDSAQTTLNDFSCA